jgi:hypothetical protein
MADFIIDPKNQESKQILYEHLKSFNKPFLVKTEKIQKRSIDWNKYYFGVVVNYHEPKGIVAL